MNNPNAKVPDLMKELGRQWQALSPEEKRYYEACALKGKARSLIFRQRKVPSGGRGAEQERRQLLALKPSAKKTEKMSIVLHDFRS